MLNVGYLFRQRVLVLVVDSNGAPKQLHPVEVVDGKDGAPLVFVLDEAESLFFHTDATTRRAMEQSAGRQIWNLATNLQ